MRGAVRGCEALPARGGAVSSANSAKHFVARRPPLWLARCSLALAGRNTAMANIEQQAGRTGSGSGKELVALIVGVVLMAGAGTLATYWVQTAGVPAGGERD